MNIGISLDIKDARSKVNDDYDQGIIFLAMMLANIDFIKNVFIVTTDEENKISFLFTENYKIKFITKNECTYVLDALILTSKNFPIALMQRLKALGTKTIFYALSNSYIDLAESSIFGSKSFHCYMDHVDVSWIFPEFEKTCRSLLEVVNRSSVFTVPHIWSPFIIQSELDHLNSHNINFIGAENYNSNNTAWRVATLDSNQSFSSNSFIPMLIADAAYRMNPAAVDFIAAFNTYHLKEHLTFYRLAINMSLTRDSKATYEGPENFLPAVKNFKIDALITHMIESSPNYYCYDALYTGLPLIHNSEFLKDNHVGFYYPEFSCLQGAKKLIYAFDNLKNPDYRKDYIRKANIFIDKISPKNEMNIEFYKNLLMNLIGEKNGQ